jgi:hypothetical protein
MLSLVSATGQPLISGLNLWSRQKAHLRRARAMQDIWHADIALLARRDPPHPADRNRRRHGSGTGAGDESAVAMAALLAMGRG